MSGLDARQHYRALLARAGLSPHGRDRVPTLGLLLERIRVTELFVAELKCLYGAVLPPSRIAAELMSSVLLAWYAKCISAQEMAERVRVAAWLFDLCVPDDWSPVPCQPGAGYE
ncbi:hypothetical protein [Roseateles violae]|uniref:Transposase InsH N-terminal domain-containing protein n=1 Tax=Roseateles violae TaxID=3058042 RepID=A0ABT8DPY8_9BURK|nr:hypothetical protein [Pelomonas sp. PFR6]MDN3920043.1 hypothetical protein [Pelomonas sp. PFR6]